MAVLNYKKKGTARKNMKKGLVWMTETIIWLGIAAALAIILLIIVFKITKSVGG